MTVPGERRNTALYTILAAILLLSVLAAAALRHAPVSRPLPKAQTVVLLLVPSLSEADCLAAANGNLANLFASNPHGVLTTRNTADGTSSGDPLSVAAQVIATGDRTPAVNSPTLAETLEKAGVSMAPLTNSDAIACVLTATPQPNPLLADTPAGRVPHADFPDGFITDPHLFAGALQMLVKKNQDTSAPRLIVATFDDLYRTDLYAPLAAPMATARQRADALARLDQAVAELTQPGSPNRLTGDTILVFLTPLPATEARQRNERLGPIALWSPNGAFGSSSSLLLTSPSTRATPGLIAGTDIAATIAELFDLPVDSEHIGEGRPARVVADDGRLPSRIAGWDAQARAQTLLIYVPWALAALLIAAILCPRWGRQRTALILSATAALYPFGLVAMGGFSTHAFVTYSAAAILAIVVPLAVLGVARLPHARSRQLFAGIGVATAGLLVGDTLTGGYLLAHTPLSYSVMEAARFYGVGNEAAGALVGAGLLVAALLLDDAPIAIGLLGLAVGLTLVLPNLGAKAGSTIGALVGFACLLILRRPLPGKLQRIPFPVLILSAIVAILASLLAYAFWDASHSADARTHVGAAIAGAHSHGLGVLFTIARRKAVMDVHLMISSPWAALLATEIVALGYIARRRIVTGLSCAKESRAGFIAFAIAAVALLFFNDAGVVGAAICLLYAIPNALLDFSPQAQKNATPWDSSRGVA